MLNFKQWWHNHLWEQTLCKESECTAYKTILRPNKSCIFNSGMSAVAIANKHFSIHVCKNGSFSLGQSVSGQVLWYVENRQAVLTVRGITVENMALWKDASISILQLQKGHETVNIICEVGQCYIRSREFILSSHIWWLVDEDFFVKWISSKWVYFCPSLFTTWPDQSGQVSLLMRPNAKSSAIMAVIGLNWPLVLSLSQSLKHTSTDRCEFNPTPPVPH